MDAKLMPAGLDILRWVFWSPETVSPTEWRAAAPTRIDKVPDRDIPASHRRRMSALSKMAVQCALEATANEHADFLVFCSQHGELPRTRELLGSLVAGTELSPAGFSQSVHNTSAGLYTIIKESHAPSTSVAAGAGTFAYGWLEAETFLAANSSKTVLLVSYDEVLPVEFRSYTQHKQRTFALALLLRVARRGGFTLEQSPAATEEPLPITPLFMAWALSTDPLLRVTAGGQGWEWRRR
ncbi:MAG: beta-ketoacyl synthase chain length factor [Gammaproteobacteria bacterium]